MNQKKLKKNFYKNWLTNLYKNEKSQDNIWFNYLYNECKKVIQEFVKTKQIPDLQQYFLVTHLNILYIEMYKLMGVDTAKWYVRNYEKYMKKQVEVSDVQLDLWEQAFAFIGETIAGERIVSVSGSRKKEFLRILRKHLQNPEFMVLGEVAAGRILRKKFKEMSAVNAKRIVRTESINIANIATNKGAIDVFGADNLQKEWISGGDARVREAHRIANGQITDMNGLFEVGGELLSHPGDSRGSAGNVINCRCVSAPIPV